MLPGTAPVAEQIATIRGELARRSAPEYLAELVGTIGGDPFLRDHSLDDTHV
jgi:hypothetical protein